MQVKGDTDDEGALDYRAHKALSETVERFAALPKTIRSGKP